MPPPDAVTGASPGSRRSERRRERPSQAADDPPSLCTAAKQTTELFVNAPHEYDRAHGTCVARAVLYFTVFVIFASQVLLLMESRPEWYQDEDDELRPSPWFPIEASIVAYFTLELLVRIWCVSWRPHFLKVFFFDILNLCDIAAVLPFYVELAVSSSVGFDFKVLRVMRVARVIKVSRFHKGLQIVGASLYQTRGELLVAFLIICLNMLIWSSLVFFLERGDAVWAPDIEEWLYDSNISRVENRTHAFQSIPHTFWWCIVTLTTVGYGDMVPQNTLAKIIAAGTMAAAVFVLALPTSIIGAKFLKLYDEHKKKRGNIDDDATTVASDDADAWAEGAEADDNMVQLLVLVDYLAETGHLSPSAVYYSAATDEHLYRPGDSETARGLVFNPATYRAMRAVYLYAIAAPTDELVAKRFVKGTTELALQQRYLEKPERTQTTTPWVPSAKALKLVTERWDTGADVGRGSPGTPRVRSPVRSPA